MQYVAVSIHAVWDGFSSDGCVSKASATSPLWAAKPDDESLLPSYWVQPAIQRCCLHAMATKPSLDVWAILWAIQACNFPGPIQPAATFEL